MQTTLNEFLIVPQDLGANSDIKLHFEVRGAQDTHNEGHSLLGREIGAN
jgi:hypothetical protein